MIGVDFLYYVLSDGRLVALETYRIHETFLSTLLNTVIASALVNYLNDVEVPICLISPS